MSVMLPTPTTPYCLFAGDCIQMLGELPDDSIDLLVTSPPYELCRTYGIADKMLGGQAWVDWMVAVVRAAAPKVKGLIAINCEGQTKNFRYSCVPFLLMADLHRAGFNLRKPAVFRRVGIPGSGGPDWLRNDWEPIICLTRPGKLPWSDNTACGHPPKWAPGGEMSYRNSDGERKNAVPKIEASSGDLKPRSRKERGEARRKAVEEGRGHKVKLIDSAEYADKETKYEWNYVPPAKANPGNVLDIKVGGGLMGHKLAHENEAPFPVKLPEFFVRSFCPPGGIVLDPFMGSGSTGQAALEAGRLFLGFDLRQSQVDLAARRLSSGLSSDLFTSTEADQ